ncbi:pyridoxamine 5'-phosphate oxidase family protein [Agromyces cerinus]|uniref:Pyridoxamine 5'-phosphate oxidase n=1 Tax=Agromyces cerinus subsp. cerinus TaxID=232089 RepID=A0A1N6EQG6_9MICO|nr:pyridoxamine 5'-phosphate oxidase family protein [Agromyces cerinus]SIN85286.1 Pyridoxamine 5'-phosphate oxidase [Agromyces cerinus subsp. cerinus]
MDDETDERPPTRHLSEDECWQRIADAQYGRIAATAAGQIDIFPINHAVDGRTIVFRTSAGTKLLELTIHGSVAFEVDGASETDAFSVVVKGVAAEFDRQGEVAEAERLGITPWAPEPKDRWVRITPTEVHGRAFERPRSAGSAG